jgi:hypothetical protein
MSKFTEVRRAFADAQERFAAYRAECVHFAAAFTRALIEDFGWPRELVRYGDGSAEHPEDVMRLAGDGCWELPVALLVRDGAASDTISFELRFRRAGDDWQLHLFPGVELEVAAPTREALAPALDALHRAVRAHYEQGLTHFLEGRSSRLHLPYLPPGCAGPTRAAAPAAREGVVAAVG